MDEHLNILRSLHDLERRYENARCMLERRVNKADKAYAEAKENIDFPLEVLISLSKKCNDDLKEYYSLLEEQQELMIIIKKFSIWCDNQRFANFGVQAEEKPDALVLSNPKNI